MVEGRKEGGGAGLASFCSNNKRRCFRQAPGKHGFPFSCPLHSRKPDFSRVLTSPQGQASSQSVCCCCLCQPGHCGHWRGRDSGQSQAAQRTEQGRVSWLQTVSTATPQAGNIPALSWEHTCSQFPSPAPHQGPFLSLGAWEPLGIFIIVVLNFYSDDSNISAICKSGPDACLVSTNPFCL